MPTVQELLAKCDDLKSKAIALLAEVRELLAKDRAALEQEQSEDNKIIQMHLEKEQRGKKAGRLAQRAAKKELAVNMMTHNERVKELASKSANMSVLVYKAERGEEQDDKRIQDLLALVVAAEKEELVEEQSHAAVLEQLEQDLKSLKTDPRQISRLNPSGQAENLQTWARIHAQLQKLNALGQAQYLMQGRIKRLREELMPLLAKETETDTKIERLLAWLRDLDEQERLVEEKEDEKTAEGTADIEEYKQAA
ncbi:MAG: hypothetical protein Q7R76_00155 [Candidatus Woesearchaeota archaeon]|nr:hypothetical protein [Candidatus Woesearchaeota archaeon]